MAADAQTAEIRGLLRGATVRSFGRAADMGVVEFDGLHGAVVRAHVQCPFRVVHEGKMILGSRDSRYPQRGAGDDAFDQFKTVYDARVTTLNGILGQLRPVVSEVSLGDAGYLAMAWEPGFRLEIFPDCSGLVEAWRVFAKGGPHYGFPEKAL